MEGTGEEFQAVRHDCQTETKVTWTRTEGKGRGMRVEATDGAFETFSHCIPPMRAYGPDTSGSSQVAGFGKLSLYNDLGRPDGVYAEVEM